MPQGTENKDDHNSRRHMHDGNIHHRPGRVEDAEALSQLAARTFEDAFGSDNPTEAMDAYMARAFRPERQATELADPTIITVIAELAEKPIAYSQLRTAEPAPPCITGPEPIELWRFYVDRRWHGKGIAQELFAAVLDWARKAEGETLWLGVWEHNGRARAFYRKHGFVDVGEHEFLLGSERQQDRVMSLPIG